MRSDTLLDYAIFQLSPKRTHCELYVSGDGMTEKLASGLLKPFVTHLTVAEEQAAKLVQSIKLEVERRKNVGTWFTKGTLERFVRFVSTPEVLELVNTFDAEMSQLESARKIYFQGMSDQKPGISGKDDAEASAAADTTKKELLRAIDLRLLAVKQDLTAACARASAAGFTLDNVSELLLFADRFGAHRLNEACSKFISLCQRRPELINLSWNGFDDRNVRSSSGSDMSLDDPNEDHNVATMNKPSPTHQTLLNSQDAVPPPEQLKPAPASSNKFPLCRSSSVPSSEKGESSTITEVENATEPPLALQQQPPVRRLSVQDRINLFENKQKEQSGSGGKIAVGKSAELRRHSSDVGSSSALADKAVLRRWSGASDMSIELNNDKKDGERSDGGTPSSSSNSQTLTHSIDPAVRGDESTSKVAGALKEVQQVGIVLEKTDELNDQEMLKHDYSGLLNQNEACLEIQLRGFAGRSHDAEDGRSNKGVESSLQRQVKIFPKSVEAITLRDPSSHGVRGGIAKGNKMQDVESERQAITSQSRAKSVPSHAEVTGEKDLPPLQTSDKVFEATQEKAKTNTHFGEHRQQKNPADNLKETGRKELTNPHLPLGPTIIESSSEQKMQLPREKSVSEQNRSLYIAKEGGISGEKDLPPLQTSDRVFEATQEKAKTNTHFGEHRQRKNPADNLKETGRKELTNPHLPLGPTIIESSSEQKMRLPREKSVSEQNRSLYIAKEGGISCNENVAPSSMEKKATESTETSELSSVALLDQVPKIRQTKGNQELNDELQMKANELEKLFAAHKLRIPGDPMVSSRSRLPDVPAQQASTFLEKEVEGNIHLLQHEKTKTTEASSSSCNEAEYDANLIERKRSVVDGPENLANTRSMEDSRGIFYERYMQKRDVKLKEEWSSKRAQKEAKMKAMEDSLERSRAEMKAKLAASGEGSTHSARRRVEKLRTFNLRSSMDQLGESFPSEGEGSQPAFSEQISFGDGARNTNLRRAVHNRSLSSATSRTPAVPVARSSSNASSSVYIKRRLQAENPLAQSVPNFSDLRKENTKPSVGSSKPDTRVQYRNYSRSKSTNEETHLAKEEKQRGSQSMRRSSVGHDELKDVSSMNSESGGFTPFKLTKEQLKQNSMDKIVRNGESKPYLRKGSRTGTVSGAGLVKLKASIGSENLSSNLESEHFTNPSNDVSDFVKVDGEEFAVDDFEKDSYEEAAKNEHFLADLDIEKQRLSQGTDKSDDPESGNGEALSSLSQADDDFTNAAGAVSSKFATAVGLVQDSPGGSPASWIQHSYTFTQEASDVDASLDSPIGSPASWNSHPMNQMVETDAARMRKKWGSAQKPVLVAHTSVNPSRKDVTRGFKRLLKFGRKSRGADSLVSDWVSASTASEGDDDTEDGRDPANRSSEDLRKSRMGFPHGGASSYDNFNEGEMFNEQVQSLSSSIPAAPADFKLREDHLPGSSLKAPRSFFSLSSFRSKGSETKPR